MVATSATSSFFPLPSSSLDPNGKTNKLTSTNFSGLNPIPNSSGRLKVKPNAQAPSKINGNNVSLPGSVHIVKTDNNHDLSQQHAPRTFINQLPDWSMLLAAITTVFLAAEKQWMMLDSKPRRSDMIMDPFGLGRIVQDGLVYRQNFDIRSYEIGADRSASIETVMNHLQSAGLLGDGFGSTPEMVKKNLIWVVTRMQVVVDKYPTWGDVVEVDTWVSKSGKNGMRRDWLVRDCNTGEILTRASSVWVMMNKVTRRLSKLPEEVRGEIEPYFVNSDPILAEDSRKLTKLDEKTADYVRSGLTPRWSDLDVNQHVNNVKYIGWILESAPVEMMEKHKLKSMTLEYRRECGRDSVLQSLTAVSGCDVGSLGTAGEVECQHLLRLQDGAEVVKGRTVWSSKTPSTTWDTTS
ncbi:hypothetical protein HID58_080762 [Brassica napus]|uniref:Acyl-[acyl-carrier-protein] hydrolase n=1 Tax=Brassica napus TaxID=3708 RepID=A0ABQ7Y5V4_BRANA|nr:hypothetical protein HID58_080762 [Brassica napus]